MNSLEGFIRQVIGWREFVHGIYQFRGTEIRNSNFWNFERPLPHSFYDGEELGKTVAGKKRCASRGSQ